MSASTTLFGKGERGALVAPIIANNPIGVQVMGPVHGVLFVIYCIAALRLAREARWSLAVTALALLASVPPFTTWLFERWVIKRG